jgi:hypothetical protein
MELPEKSAGAAGSGSNGLSMTTEKRLGLLIIFILWSTVPEKSAGAAGSGSNELSMTTEKRRGLLIIFILWVYLRKAPARQVVADQV